MTGQSNLIISFLLLLTSGCAGTHIARNSSQVGLSHEQTLRQQVLDNLAKFRANPGAIPHLAIPQLGASDVTQRFDSGPGFSFTPFGLTGWTFGFNGAHTDDSGFTLTTVKEPAKLALMRCVYQQALYGQCQCSCTDGCPNCDLLFKKFYFGTEYPGQVSQMTADGKGVFMYHPEQVAEVLAKLRVAKLTTSSADESAMEIGSLTDNAEMQSGSLVQVMWQNDGKSATTPFDPGHAESEQLDLNPAVDAQDTKQFSLSEVESRVRDARKEGRVEGESAILDTLEPVARARATPSVGDDLPAFNPADQLPTVVLEYDLYNVPVLRNPVTNEIVASGENTIKHLEETGAVRLLYEPQTLASLTRRSGRVTPACLGSGWIRDGKPTGSLRKQRCCDTGSYCGTNIFVPASAQDELSKLTLIVLQIALNDPPAATAPKTPEHKIIFETSGIPVTISESSEAMKKIVDSSTSGVWDDPSRLQNPERAAKILKMLQTPPKPLQRNGSPLIPDAGIPDQRRSPETSLLPLGIQNRQLELVD